ncbi:MAG: hypothetical protein ITF98_09630 [Fermentimonas sp.]|nr:hypothetical protein [Fermentimonas sp.]
MKKTIQFYIALIAAVLIITTACDRDEAEQFPLHESDSFSIDVSFGKLSTRALTTEDGDADGAFNENKINSLDIFFYEGSTLKWRVTSPAYDDATKQATIAIATDKRALFDNVKLYYIYVVANNTANLSTIIEGGNNLQTLKDIVFQTTSFETAGGNTPQTSFVMDGMISKVVDINSPELGTVSLKRAAAKMRLNLIGVNIPGFTQEGNASARLVHFTDKSSLMNEGAVYSPNSTDWKETGYKELSKEYTSTSYTTETPFYAYENDWNGDNTRETYFELYIPLKEDATEITKTYKYRVPISPRDLTGEDAQYMKKLQRNFLYDVSVTVKMLGSIEELPVEVAGNYIIKDWGTHEILVDIKGSHYLVVSERVVTMPNINSYTLTFNSSIPNVTLEPNSLKATYTYVPAGSSSPTTEDVIASQQPTVTVQAGVAAGTIIINSPIPVNYIPKDIVFDVTNGTLTESVIIRQLPSTYFTVTKGIASNLPDEGYRTSLPSGNNNPYMYAVTTLAPTGDIIWGFPPIDEQGQTLNNEEVSKMVSPKFEMASQFGAVQRKNYADGQKQCKGYTETAEGGTIKTGWRLPTAAEIHFIDVIQQTAPTKYVMRGAYYWSSWSLFPTQNWSGNTVYGAYEMGIDVPTKNHTDSYNTGATYNSAHVRCIRDIKN